MMGGASCPQSHPSLGLGENPYLNGPLDCQSSAKSADGSDATGRWAGACSTDQNCSETSGGFRKSWRLCRRAGFSLSWSELGPGADQSRIFGEKAELGVAAVAML